MKQTDNEYQYIMKWKSTAKLSPVNSTEVIAMWPKLLSDFLEPHLEWLPNDDTTEFSNAAFNNDLDGAPVSIECE